MSLSLFAVAPLGCEFLLQRELQALGIDDCREAKGGVRFRCDWTAAMRALLEVRTASRMLLEVSEFPLRNEADLYQATHACDWHAWFSAEHALRVDVSGRHEALSHSGFAALRVKDAIVDRFRALGQRPDIDKEHPDVVVHLHMERERGCLYLNLAAGVLHERAWRVAQVTAPLKENLASALLLRAGWQVMGAQGAGFLDPFCGGGTLLIEAIWIAAGVPPTWLRSRFAIECLKPAPIETWRELRAELDQRARQGLAALGRGRFFAGDVDQDAIHACKRNLSAAGVAGHVDLRRIPAVAWEPAPAESGLVLSNPPYGERLGAERELVPLYREWGQSLKQHFSAWQVNVLTTGDELVEALGMPVRKRHKFMNGALECQFVQLDPARRSSGPRVLSPGAQMVANRIEKNLARLKSYLSQQAIQCYRAYDADLPEYSAAVDVYDGRVHVQEYQAPRHIPEEDQLRRFKEILLACGQALGVPSERIYSKQRAKQRGTTQYQRMGRKQEHFLVQESGLKFWVNLADFLDTGLFLDTRMVRSRIRELATGKDFLNLFCYTASASIYAAAGGARSSISVDLSPTYVDWAVQNYQLNGLDLRQHQLIEGDAVRWLAQAEQQFDLIYLDPPTFSNSKRTPTVLDIQRDHVELLASCRNCLRAAGEIIFVTNHRGFKLDPLIAEQWSVEDWSRSTLPPDFARDVRLRQVYRLRFKQLSEVLDIRKSPAAAKL